MPSYSVENVSNNSKRATRIYKDLDLDFGRNVVTNDVNKLTDVEAVKRSVRNLIQTNHFERPFHPEIGGNVRALLFELISPLTALNLQRKMHSHSQVSGLPKPLMLIISCVTLRILKRGISFLRIGHHISRHLLCWMRLESQATHT